MTPTSESLEEFHDRIKSLDGALSKLNNTEVRGDLVAELARAAKDWLRVAPELKNTAEGYLPSLDKYDLAMTGVLTATKLRSRTTAYRPKLQPFVVGFLDAIVVPLIRFEGSPSQSAARQLEGLFASSVTAEELPYILEAARCSSVHCHRAAIILLWAAGIARLHSRVGVAGFAAFNAAADVIGLKKGQPFIKMARGLVVNSVGELQRSRDVDVLLVGMELWKYDLQAYEELERLLSLRNSAAHPGMFQPGSLDVRQFAEKLKRYVFELVR